MSFSIYMPTRWLFGAGALNELGRQPLPRPDGAAGLVLRPLGQGLRIPLTALMELLAHGGAEFRLL